MPPSPFPLIDLAGHRTSGRQHGTAASARIYCAAKIWLSTVAHGTARPRELADTWCRFGRGEPA
jgi:hypothetical protein